VQVVPEHRCFPCLKTEAEATFGTYRCFKIKTVNKLKKKKKKKKLVSLSCVPLSELGGFELEFSSKWSAITYYVHHSLALRHTVTSPREFLHTCITCYSI